MPHSLSERRAYMAELRRRYRVAGLCMHCGMVEVQRYSRCTRCRRKYAKHSKAWYERHRERALVALRARIQRWRAQRAHG